MGTIKKRDLNLSKMRNLAKLLANSAKTGDTICLQGELGVGKTSFARLFINEMAKKNGKKLTESDVGGRVDFIDDIAGSYLKIVNPNATSECGCGESFSV